MTAILRKKGSGIKPGTVQFERHPDAAGLRWWSTLEASWIHVTLFDRALGAVNVRGVRMLTVDDEAVATAATHLGLA